MSTAANHTRRASHSSSVPPAQETSYLRCPEGRIGYDVAGGGSLVVLVPGMGDLRAGYRFLAPALRAAGYPAEARLADVTAPALVVMGEQDPDFPDPRAEADWIARALRAHVMVPEAGHYPQSQRPDITTGAVPRILESVTGRA
jgi:pimeloyl-ACP methyl ester carboxylesterase